MTKFLIMAGMISALSTSAIANEISLRGNHDHGGTSITQASSHAPIGVMSDHIHKQGEWMLSYRYMHMNMEGNKNGSKNISPETIATTVSNRFSGTAGQPATLRVVPTQMRMDMHMLGAMFAPTDWVTLMGMLNHISKDMDHRTFQGGSGTSVLGEFNTKSSGWGDAKIGALFGIYKDDTHALNIKAGLSLPTGSIDEDDDVLAPNGMRPTLRLPYAMQLGTGTYDIEPTITYVGQAGAMGWGAQYSSVFHIGENSEDYTWGDKHEVTAWGSYDWKRNLSTSLRITAETEDSIDGIDSSILAPVQTADPDNYGGDRMSLGLGANYAFKQEGFLKDHRLAFEVIAPIYQDLNGPQLERDLILTVGWQKAF